jgi:nicotinamidase-related amidase
MEKTMKRVKVQAQPRPRGENTALIVIDVQRELFKKSTRVYQAEALLANINSLINKARLAGVPITFVQHSSSAYLIEGSEGWQLHSRLHPAKEDIMIRKLHGNSFEDTPLEEKLEACGVGNLVVTGMVTQGCVRATTLGALELGYRVILVIDGHSSYSKDADKQIDKWNQKLSEAGAIVKATSEINF